MIATYLNILVGSPENAATAADAVDAVVKDSDAEEILLAEANASFETTSTV